MRQLLPLALLALALAACRSAPEVEEEDLTPRPRQLTAAFLIVDGVYGTELTAPLDVLHHTAFHAQPGMRVFTVAPSLEPVRTFEGLRIVPDYAFTSAPPIDVLVVPSAEHSMGEDLENEAMITWVRVTGARARYVLSLCDGAFVLAKARLLDRREATTFPEDVARFRELFGDRVEVQEGVSFVHDGPMITSVGGAKSFEAALYLCELLYGDSVARRVGRGLVIDWDLDAIGHRIAE